MLFVIFDKYNYTKPINEHSRELNIIRKCSHTGSQVKYWQQAEIHNEAMTLHQVNLFRKSNLVNEPK